MPPPAAATGGGAAAGRSVVPSATVMVVAVLLVRPSLHPASSSVAVPAKTVARAAPARRRVSTAAAAATAAVFHPDNWLSGHVYPTALPLSWVGRSERAELAQVGIMFFSAAQTPPSHHSLAPSHIVFLISPLSLPLYEVFPSPASFFFFRIPRPRLAHSSCPAGQK